MNDFNMGGAGGGDSDDEEEEEEEAQEGHDHGHEHGEHCNHGPDHEHSLVDVKKSADLGDLDADVEEEVNTAP